MKLAKRFATISAAATAAILFSATGAQAQSNGGLLSLLDSIPLLRMPYTMGATGQGDTPLGAQTTNNNNNNNNNAGGPNNNNNNNNGDSQTQGNTAGLLPLLGKSLFNFQVCYPKGQVGSGNTFTGNQNINCHQS
ncbi:hypothetical protein [Streptomyces misionensis]|uniref:hypothetical protein n=1 Tax=Streptomyces misionensis TaxID=67331 RepID=UPI00396B66D6